MIGAITAGLFSVAGPPAPTLSYDSIATTTVGAGGQSSITFSSIPSTYKHLQIRGIGRATSGSQLAGFVTFNGDSGANYSFHQLYGSGVAVGNNGGTSTNGIYYQKISGSTDLANAFGAVVIDILDYSNTSKNKTLRYLGGSDINGGSGWIFFGSGAWYNTAAISSITIVVDTSNFAQYSQLALYGIKG